MSALSGGVGGYSYLEYRTGAGGPAGVAGMWASGSKGAGSKGGYQGDRAAALGRKLLGAKK